MVVAAIEPTLAELAAASGLQPRTVRSWVAQGLLSGPLSRGPFARYPADTLERLLAVRVMRDLLGMPLSTIRHELLIASPEQIRAYAAKAVGLSPEVAEPPHSLSRLSSPDSALAYLQSLRAETAGGPMPVAGSPSTAAPIRPSPQLAALTRRADMSEPPSSGFEALERRLAEARAGKPPARKARAEEWFRIPVTPDVELSIRGPLDAEQRVRLERCADLIRDLLLGRDR